MKDWLKEHQILLLATIGLIVAHILLYLFILSPHAEELQELQGSIGSMRSRMRGGQWPQDAGKLEAYLKQLTNEMEGRGKKGNLPLNAAAKATMDRASRTFAGKLKSKYGNVDDFMKNVARLEYQSYFNQVITSLKERGVVLSTEKLGLSEEMSTRYVYQSVLHLWTVEKLVAIALDSGVSLVTDKNGRNRRGPQPALISVQPMKSYMDTPAATRPFLLEFPVSIQVQGSLAQCMTFLENLNTEEQFIPPVAFEIFSLPPTEIKRAETGLLEPGDLKMNLVCSSFLVL